MIITKIEKSKKGNILIYADNNYLTSLSPEVFLKSKLKVGDYLDKEILKKVNADSDHHKAKEKALRLLSFRAHSKKELENKIKLRSTMESAQYAADKMEELGLFSKTAVIVCETDKTVELPETVAGFHQIRKQIYGITAVTIYRKEGNQ